MPATPKGRASKYEDPPRQKYWHWSDMFVGMDMFGVRPTLEVQGKRKYKSCWGAFISFIALLLILLFTFFQLLETQKYSSQGQEFIKTILGEEPSGLFYHKYSQTLFSEIQKYNQDMYEYGQYKSYKDQGFKVKEMPEPKLSEDAQQMREDLYAHDEGARLVRTHLFMAFDAIALVGGFIYFVQILFSTVVKCLNRKLYIRTVLTDSFLLQKNEGYLCVPAGYLAKHNRKTPKGDSQNNGSLRKLKPEYDTNHKRSTSAPGTSRSANLGPIPEEEGEDKSNYESLREGGNMSLNQSNSLGSKAIIADEENHDGRPSLVAPSLIAPSPGSSTIIDYIGSVFGDAMKTERYLGGPNKLELLEDDSDYGQRDRPGSDDEKWAEENSDENDKIQMFEKIDDYNNEESKDEESESESENDSCFDESESSEDFTIQQEQRMTADPTDFNSFSPMLEKKKRQQQVELQDIELEEMEGGSRNGGSQRSKTSVLSPKSHRSGTKLPEMSQRSGMSKASAAQSKRSMAQQSIRSENSQMSRASSRGSSRPPRNYQGKPRSDFVKINISDWQIFRLQITPFCCRTKYQKAVARMFEKGIRRLHRELEVGSLLKSIREAKFPVRSFANAHVFNPPDLVKEYQTHYVNALEISMKTQDSIQEELANPIPVEYMEPNPTCVCPDLGEENMFKITNAALETLRAESQLMGLIDDQNKKKKAAHEGGNSDKISKKSRMNSSGRKIMSDDLVDKSSKKGKNDPIQIMLPKGDSIADLQKSQRSKRLDTAPREPSEAPKTDIRSLKSKPNDDGPMGTVESRKSSKKSVSPSPAKPDKKKKDKDKKEKKDKEKDKKDKKDKDKRKKSSKKQDPKKEAKAEEPVVTGAKTEEQTPH